MFDLAKITPLGASVVALTIGFVGCQQGDIANTPPAVSTVNPVALNKNLPQVVATTTVLCDLTKQIAADTINLNCLIPIGADPHLYQPRPEDRKAIEQAKLIFYNGYDFDPVLSNLIQATKNPAPKLAVSEVARPQPEKLEEDGKILPDPHIWHDAKNTVKMVDIISSNLGKISPKDAALYNSNAQKIKSELTQLDTWIKSQIATIPPQQRKLVTTDNAMRYYSKAYGLSFEGFFVGFNTDEKPSASRLKTLIQDIKQTNVPTIFPEITINPQLINTVAREAKVKVSERSLFADSLGEPGSEGETYQKMMITNTRTIVEGLGGKYVSFEPKSSS